MQGRKPADEHAPVRRGASGGHRDPAARDGEARGSAKHAVGETPQAHLVAREDIDPLLALPDLTLLRLSSSRPVRAPESPVIRSRRDPILIDLLKLNAAFTIFTPDVMAGECWNFF